MRVQTGCGSLVHDLAGVAISELTTSTTRREESRELSPTLSEPRSNKRNKFGNVHGSKHAEIIKISEQAAKAMTGVEECAFVGSESSTTMK